MKRTSLQAGPQSAPAELGFVLLVGADDENLRAVQAVLEQGRVAVLAPTPEVANIFLAQVAESHAGKEEHFPRLIERGGLAIDMSSRRVLWRGWELPLTRQEFQIMAVLARDPDRCWSFQEISTAVWEGEFYTDAGAVRSAIQRLRKKLRGFGAGKCISSVRGVGYRLEGSPAESDARLNKNSRTSALETGAGQA